MNSFKRYASSCAFRVELTSPQIAKIYETGKAAETGDWKMTYTVHNKLVKSYGGVNNFIATEHALIRKGLVKNNREAADGSCVILTEEGKAIYGLLKVAGFFEEFEQVYLEYKQANAA
jgi:hypothetical protein